MTPLNYAVIDAPDSSLNKTSLLVTGESEALLVAAGFTRADGHRTVAEVLDAFDTTVADAPDAAEAALKAAYPDAWLGITATLGTRVTRGEMTWG